MIPEGIRQRQLMLSCCLLILPVLPEMAALLLIEIQHGAGASGGRAATAYSLAAARRCRFGHRRCAAPLRMTVPSMLPGFTTPRICT